MIRSPLEVLENELHCATTVVEIAEEEIAGQERLLDSMRQDLDQKRKRATAFAVALERVKVPIENVFSQTGE